MTDSERERLAKEMAERIVAPFQAVANGALVAMLIFIVVCAVVGVIIRGTL